MIKERSGSEVALEGCLSLPGISVSVARPMRLLVRGYDVNGKRRTYGLADLAARVLQHEIDHLNGVLISDYGKRLQRMEQQS